jgi:hypothetical protein
MQRTVEIPLTRGLSAIIDAADAELILSHKWYATPRGNTFYAMRMANWVDGKRPSILMHREILGLTDADVHADHRDLNGLNNRRSNLRSCTRFENHRNSALRKDNAIGFKGVGFNRRIGLYHARIFVRGKSKYLGSFGTPEDAHRAYCNAAAAYFGEFARFS